MPGPLRPQLRPLSVVPAGSQDGPWFRFEDPEGYGELALPAGAAMLAMLMDGRRTLAEIQEEFRQRTGTEVPLSDLEEVVRRLDETYMLAGERSDLFRHEQVESYRSAAVRPAFHAGRTYEREPEALRAQMAGFFTCDEGPGEVDFSVAAGRGRLRGIISPHIDLYRGGPVFARAYKELAEGTDADLFVIFGTAHAPMQERYSVSRKDFDTPLGIVRSDRDFIDHLAADLASSVAGRQLDPLTDEMAHRLEHSIEFQAVFLQYLFAGKRDFRIVPILVSSFEDFFADNVLPDESTEVQAFLAALRAAVSDYSGNVCYISGADLAHIGQRFGDPWPVDEQRLAEQSGDDRKLLELACRGDSAGVFRHVAGQEDRRRICGLAPTYMMLQAMGPARGELLKYAQAVAPDQTSCVSFASVAYYHGE